MGDLLYITGNFLLKGAIRQMLTGAGLALTTAAVSLALINQLIQRVQAELSGLPSLAIALINLSQVDAALSLMLGAVVARATINAARLQLGILR